MVDSSPGPEVEAASASAQVVPGTSDRRALLRAGAIVGGAAAVGAFGIANAATALAVAPTTLYLGQRLSAGQYLLSGNGSYRAVMQPDGNFVVYGPSGAKWHTHSAGWTGASFCLTSDGNLQLQWTGGAVLWSSGTNGKGAYRLTMQGDGNLVLYTKAGVALWAISRVAQPAVGSPATVRPLPTSSTFGLHLLRRATFGVNSSVRNDVTSLGGIQKWLDWQLSPATIDDHVCDGYLKRWPMAFIDPPTAHAQMSFGGWDAMEQLVEATLARQLFSRRQLFEVMVDFWSNHLNITTPSSEPWATKMWDDSNVIRKYALGRFDDMLVASMKSPAMLQYLGNADSRGSNPNENYGRELLELHTVGVDAGYGHDGVINAARVMTGFTVWNPWNGGTTSNYGTFRYRSSWHYVGPVTVLGWSHPNGDSGAGLAAAESLGRYLAMHPATAKRIARKLAVRFVSDSPTQALVDSLAKVYLANNTSIVPVLRALFGSAEFAMTIGRKMRRPAEDAIAAVRGLGVGPDLVNTAPDAVQGWRWAIDGMSNAPLGWPQPDGYPDVASAWAGAGMTLQRWNIHLGIAQQWWKSGVTFPDLPTYLLGATKPTTRGGLVDALTAKLLPGIAVSSVHRTALINLLGPDGPLGSGDLTWMFVPLVAMVLNSPYWSVR